HPSHPRRTPRPRSSQRRVSHPPFAGNNFNSLSIHIQRALHKTYESTYFTRHLAFTVPAAILSIAAVIYAAFLPVVAFWISSIFIAAVLAAHFTPIFRDFLYRRYRDPGNWAGILAILLSATAVMAGLAHNLKHFEYVYLLSLLVTLVLNLIAPDYLRVPKLAARALAPAIEGYREFLSRVGVDPLHRLDLPGSWEAYVASSHPVAPVPITPSTSRVPAPSASPATSAIPPQSSSSAASHTSLAAATLNSVGPAARLRVIPTSGPQWRFIPKGEASESDSPLRRNWWRYAILLFAIAIICSPLMNSEPISAYRILFAVAVVFAVLGFLFRRRE